MVSAKFDKKTAIMGTGAGVGLIQSYLTRDLWDPTILPGLVLWGKMSTLGNILIGGLAFGLSSFTNTFKGNTQIFLQGYGFVTLLGGLFNGIFPNLVTAQGLGRTRTMSHGKPVNKGMPVRRNLPPRATPGNGGVILS